MSRWTLPAVALSAFALLTACDPDAGSEEAAGFGGDAGQIDDGDDGEDDEDGEDEGDAGQIEEMENEEVIPVCPGVGALECEGGSCTSKPETADFLVSVEAALEDRGLGDAAHLTQIHELESGDVATYEVLVADYWVNFELEVPDAFDAQMVSDELDSILGEDLDPTEALSFGEVNGIALECHTELAELDPVADFDGLSCDDFRFWFSSVRAFHYTQEPLANDYYRVFTVHIDALSGELVRCEGGDAFYGDDSGEGG